MRIIHLGKLAKKAGKGWLHGGALRMSAGLAFYAVFSIAPLLIVVTFLFGLIHRGDTLEQVRAHFADLVSPQAANLIARAVVNAGATLKGSVGYAIFAFLMMVLGASVFTYQLQHALHAMWDVTPRRRRQGLLGAILHRLETVVVAIVAGILLQIFVVLGAGLSGYRRYVDALFPHLSVVWPWIDYGVTFAVIGGIFCLSYKLLPDVKVAWRDVAVGAIVATVLFSAGKWVVALYVFESSLTSVYGAAGSAMVLLAWLYYSSLVFLYGAKFAEIWAESLGRTIGRKPGGQKVRFSRLG